MSDSRRVLPSWMANTAREKEPPRSRKKRRVARAAFYCMNEKELVEAAVSLLADGACRHVVSPDDQQVQDKAADNGERIQEKASSSKPMTEPVTEVSEGASDSDAQDTTYVSETDLDITEVETLPYAEHQQAGGQRSGPAQHHSRAVNVERTEDKSQTPASTAAEDDDFRLVREIFFT